MQLSDNTVHRLLYPLFESGDWDYANEYGEPGYPTDNVTAVITGYYWLKGPNGELNSWWDKYPRLMATLEEAGYHFEWCDEWYIDHESSKAYRTQPNSYQWQPSIMYADGEVLTPDDGIDAWIEYCINDPKRAIHGSVWSSSDLIEAGFTPYNGIYQNGWHQHMDDDPTDIFAKIRAADPDLDVVFLISGVSQFYLDFEAYVREEV
jgi:hypothetical protein